MALGVLSLVVALGASQAPLSVAVLPLTPLNETPADVATLLSEEVVAQFRDRKAFPSVLSPREVTQVMTPAQQAELARCAQDNCAMVDMELAGALGVTHLFAGSVGRLGATYLLHFKILELRTARVVANVARQVTGTGPELLLPLVRPAVDALLDELGMLKPATQGPPPVATATPAEGGGGNGLVPRLAGVALLVLGGLGIPLALGAVALGAVVSLAAYSIPAIPRAVPIRDTNARLFTAFIGPVATGGVGGALLLLGGLAIAAGGVAVLAWSFFAA